MKEFSKDKRIDDLLNYIKSKNKVSLIELQHKFNISISTLRRDINYLKIAGEIKKIYGGVEINSQKEFTPFKIRSDINTTGKDQIAKKAASLIKSGDVIFLDSGTTVGRISKYLHLQSNLTVITNNMFLIPELINFPNIQLITLSGEYNANTHSFIGLESENILKSFNITVAMMGTTGFSIKAGITHSNKLEAGVKKAAVNIASEVYLLADHRKVDTFAPYTYCSFDDISAIISDLELPSMYKYKTDIITV